MSLPAHVQSAIDTLVEWAVKNEREVAKRYGWEPVCERKLACYIGGQIEVAITEPDHADADSIELD